MVGLWIQVSCAGHVAVAVAAAVGVVAIEISILVFCFSFIFLFWKRANAFTAVWYQFMPC